MAVKDLFVYLKNINRMLFFFVLLYLLLLFKFLMLNKDDASQRLSLLESQHVYNS